jgi:hypothetical protein
MQANIHVDWNKGFQSHPRNLPQYVHITFRATASINIPKSAGKFHNTFWCSLVGPL